YAIVCHVRHDCVQVVRIKRIGERLKKGFSDCGVCLGHKCCWGKCKDQEDSFHRKFLGGRSGAVRVVGELVDVIRLSIHAEACKGPEFSLSCAQNLNDNNLSNLSINHTESMQQ